MSRGPFVFSNTQTAHNNNKINSKKCQPITTTRQRQSQQRTIRPAATTNAINSSPLLASPCSAVWLACSTQLITQTYTTNADITA
eukprot:m.275774 g.275774  ORF g.275774 m.275774 type:complete len:85 (+) comp77800_c0_seq1:35-289(+)